MNILIVDDEPLAQDILESYVGKIEGLELAGKCNNALEAFGALNTKQVDLMLLDINMPEISGIDFLRSLKDPPMVIFTTAYSEFAVSSYEVDAIDYLLKPVPFDRFLKAIQKARAKQKLNPIATVTGNSGNDVSILFVRSEGRLVKIDLDKLWYVEGLKDYVRFRGEEGSIVVHSTMKNLEDQLASRSSFVRVSKSYIINIRYVMEVDGNAIRLKDQTIAIGSTYKDAVHELFNGFKLI